ncbi:MAG: hypothetical protein WDO18_17000 [Acidobacteriota bacterium]
MLKNVTITLDEETLRWARHEAAEKGTSVSKFVAETLDRERQRSDAYWAALERWKKLPTIPGFDASKRMTREQTHARGK